MSIHKSGGLIPPAVKNGAQAVMAFTRAVKRETFRDAVFLCMIPFCAPRANCGVAVFKAASASAFLPDVIASSTLRTVERTMLVRFLLMMARREATRVAFLADDVLAIIIPVSSDYGPEAGSAGNGVARQLRVIGRAYRHEPVQRSIAAFKMTL